DQIGGSRWNELTSVSKIADGGYITGGYFQDDITLSNGEKLTSKGDYDGLVIKYNREGQIEWTDQIGGSGVDGINSIAETADGGYIAGGRFRKDITLSNGENLTCKGNCDGLIIKYNREGKIEWTKQIEGNSIKSESQIASIAETEDGGYIAGGYFQSKINLSNGKMLTSKGSSDGLIIKYNNEGQIEWTEQIGRNGINKINSVAETADGGYIAGGYFQSNITLSNGKTLTSKGGFDGLILKLKAEKGVPEVQELTVENNIKRFKITTDIQEIDGIKGGNISGEDKLPYETVEYDASNTKEIKMTPEEGYEITKITVNGEEIEYTVAEDGSYILPQFTNIQENKHIVVTFIKSQNKLTIHKT
ncbi:MAG: hypothetical protein HFJ38_08100, partial [Bacilli bacterium]|nr:hypothetical protein [Bacilli bacterium]